MNELDVLKRFRDDVPEPSTDAWLRARAAIDAARAETSEPPPQPAPLRLGGSHHRRRLAALGLATVVVLATVGVTHALAKQGPRAPLARSDASGRTTVRPAVIRSRLIDALSGEKGTIFYTQSSTEVPGQPASNSEEWDYPWNGQPGQIVRQAGSRSVGGTVQGEWSLTFTVPTGGATTNSAQATGTSCGVSGQRTDIDLTNQTWQPSEQSCVALTPGLDGPAAFLDPTTHQLTSNIKTLAADGLVQVVDLSHIAGQPTVEFKSDTQGASTLDLWVNATTYLPIQSVTTYPTFPPGGASELATETTQYSYLTPSPSNLANLQVAVPPGFTKIVSPGKG
jgi:hypothetical protein